MKDIVPSPWERFLAWVERTSLFHAIKNDPAGTQIVTRDNSISFKLSGIKVEKATDLPREVLIEFLKNSPWMSKEDSMMQLMERQLEFNQNQKQLPNGSTI